MNEEAVKLPTLTESSIPSWMGTSAIFFLVLFIQLPFIHLGISFTDLGYHLTNQKLADFLGLQYIKVLPYWWLSDLIAGLWLRMTDGYGLWGARMGGCAIIAATASLFASTLFHMTKPSLGIILLLVFAGIGASSGTIMDYNNLPQFFFALLGLFFLKMHLQPFNKAYQIACGIGFPVLTLLRIPMILTFIVPVIGFVLCAFMDRNRLSEYARAYRAMFCSSLLCFALIFFVLYLNGVLHDYLFFPSFSKSHSAFSLLNLYLSHIYEKIPYMLLLICAGSSLFFALKHNFVNSKAFLFIALTLCILFVCLIFACIHYPLLKETLAYQFVKGVGFSIYLTCLMLSAVSICLLRKTIALPEMLIFLLASSYPILRQIGSDGGFRGIYAGVLLIGFTAVLLSRLASLHQCKLLLSCLFLPLLLLIGYGIAKRLGYSQPIPNCDWSSTANFTSRLSSPRLSGIYTTPKRAHCLDSLIDEIGKRSQKGDRILAFPNLSMIYYATNTFPLGNHSWIFPFDQQRVIDELKKIAQGPLPVLIVKPKMDVEHLETLRANFEWYVDTEEGLLELKTKTKLFDELILKRWDAQLIWANDLFELFIPASKTVRQETL